MTASRAPHRAPAPPSVQDYICLLYEHSLVPVREIARLAGLTERNVYATVRRRGCRPRVHVGAGAGRRIVVPANEAAPEPLDLKATRQVIAAFATARQRALDAVAARAAAAQAREQRAAEREAEREQEAELRAMAERARDLLAEARWEWREQLHRNAEAARKSRR
jgi:hypothetical protein